MRWKEKTKQKVYNKTKFLIFPKCIKGQWRWLEKATWEVEIYYGYDGGYPIAKKWIDK